MQATRPLTRMNFGVPTGAWRWAAIGFVLIALGAAGVSVTAADTTGWLGIALLGGIGAVACLFAYAVWPREGLSAADARRVAEAATRANVAWAITGSDGAVLDCNDVYRRMAGAGERDAPPPPELALAGEKSAGVLYRLSKGAAERVAREESFLVVPGLEIVTAVRPLSDGQTAWWFTPRLAASAAAAASLPARTEPARPVVVSPGVSELFRDAPMGVAFTDSDGKIEEANPAFAAFFGLSGTLKGRALDSLVEERDRAPLRDLIARSTSGSSGTSVAELRAAGQDDRMAELFASPMPAGRAILYLVDVSEQKALEIKFAQSQKMQAVGQLAGGVAHDFNNLLTVIIGNSEFLLMRHVAGDPSFKEINEIHQNALRAATLVGQLLAFSRKQTLQPKLLAVRDVVSELALMLRRLLREGVELKLEHGADVWPVHADEAQLSNAIINLVVNARDAMPKGGTVTISTANETAEAADGARHRHHAGGRLCAHRSRPTPDRHRQGTSGQDLRSLLHDQAGRTGHGPGPCHRVRHRQADRRLHHGRFRNRQGHDLPHLPAALPARGKRRAAVEPERAAPRDVTGQDTILLVEDEEAVRSFAARALRMRGYNVLEASGGEEALEIVRNATAPIHLLITDVVMPNMDGPTMVRAVKRIKPEMAVIFMSGYAEEAFRRNDEKAEDLHFLPKPFGLKQLAAKVKEVLSGAPAPKRAAPANSRNIEFHTLEPI